MASSGRPFPWKTAYEKRMTRCSGSSAADIAEDGIPELAAARRRSRIDGPSYLRMTAATWPPACRQGAEWRARPGQCR